MAGNNAIHILRGGKNYDPANVSLEDGQPFYSKKTKKLYIGDTSRKTGLDDVAALDRNIEKGSVKQKNPGLNAEGNNQFVIGTYNNNNTDNIFEIGNGTSESSSNAFEVLKDGAATINVPLNVASLNHNNPTQHKMLQTFGLCSSWYADPKNEIKGAIVITPKSFDTSNQILGDFEILWSGYRGQMTDDNIYDGATRILISNYGYGPSPQGSFEQYNGAATITGSGFRDSSENIPTIRITTHKGTNGTIIILGDWNTVWNRGGTGLIVNAVRYSGALNDLKIPKYTISRIIDKTTLDAYDDTSKYTGLKPINIIDQSGVPYVINREEAFSGTATTQEKIEGQIGDLDKIVNLQSFWVAEGSKGHIPPYSKGIKIPGSQGGDYVLLYQNGGVLSPWKSLYKDNGTFRENEFLMTNGDAQTLNKTLNIGDGSHLKVNNITTNGNGLGANLIGQQFSGLKITGDAFIENPTDNKAKIAFLDDGRIFADGSVVTRALYIRKNDNNNTSVATITSEGIISANDLNIDNSARNATFSGGVWVGCTKDNLGNTTDAKIQLNGTDGTISKFSVKNSEPASTFKPIYISTTNASGSSTLTGTSIVYSSNLNYKPDAGTPILRIGSSSNNASRYTDISIGSITCKVNGTTNFEATTDGNGVFTGNLTVGNAPSTDKHVVRKVDMENGTVKALILKGQYTGSGGLQGPSYVGTFAVKCNMMSKFKGIDDIGFSSYADVLMMNAYSWSDVPYATALAIQKTDGVPKAWIAAGGNADNWSGATELITKNNLSSSVNSLNSIDISGSSNGSVKAKIGIFTNEFKNSDSSFKVNSSGEVTAASYNAKSDKRLKENFQSYKCKKSILDLPIYKFDFINGPKNQIGCIAQELQEICPEIVNEGEDGYLSIQENKIVYLLLDEVKQLKEQLSQLKNERVEQ